MKLIIENIGKIKKAEIDLDHQLTVFFGPNNTGKTYVSYCLYGLNAINPFGHQSNGIADLFPVDFEKLYQDGSINIDLKNFFLSKKSVLKEKFIEGYRNFLPRLFGNYEIDFSKSNVFLSFFDNEYEIEKVLKRPSFSLGGIRFKNDKKFDFISHELPGFVTLKLGSGFNIEFSDDEERNIIERNLRIGLVQRFFAFINMEAFFIPAERIGVSVFGKDLVYNRFEKSNLPDEKSNFFPYSIVIEKAIVDQDVLRRVKARHRFDTFFAIAEEIESEILNGELSVDDEGNIFYGYEDNNTLPIRNSASNIKALSSFVFYLKYFAKEGETLFIDEPEINLHPENQIKIARILAKIANLGIKVYVSTHSDYILREFNNLMMLGKDDPEKDRLMKEYGYKHDEVLNYKNVGAYLFKEGLAKPVEVTEIGFEVETIDETINKQNKASNDIMWTLFES